MTRWTRRITGLTAAMEGYPEEKTLEEVQAAFLPALREDPAYDEVAADSFNDAYRELEAARTEEDFDWALDELYDWADRERVWIEPYAVTA